MNSEQLKQCAAIITGGGSGLGAATAKLLRHTGCEVILLDVDAIHAQKTADELGCTFYSCDVTSADSVATLFNRIKTQHQPIRIGINCAGIAPGKRVLGKQGPMPLSDFERVININLIGTFNVLRLLADIMAQYDPLAPANERGVIINTASIAAYEGQIGQTAYSASKAGVIGLTLPAARELARFGIRVMTIAPGLFNTPMLQGLSAEVQDSLNAATLFPHRLGTPQEFALLALQIIENSMLNGSVIRLDGGVRLASE